MKINLYSVCKFWKTHVETLYITSLLLPFVQLSPVMAAPNNPQHLRVVVNSNRDDPIQPDNNLTLREAIEIVNGTLLLEDLSEAERGQVESLRSETTSRIEFNLPPTETTIHLVDLLPPLASPGLVVDGTTQPRYDSTQSTIAEIPIPTPIVAITPAENKEILRGLTIVADNVAVQGLSLYGFTAQHRNTAATPPADIFISHRLPPPDTSQQQPPARDFPFHKSETPPQNVVIENNWLGIPPDESMPAIASAFGVSVFNSQGTTIRRNRITHHDGSGIITSVQAKNLHITENILVGNGIAGMPDAIRLEGDIENSQINSNLICGNDGSGIYLFKPQGAVEIRDNQIKFNGRRLRRAAIYLMGNDHQVIDNGISDQTGPGVVVAAYPNSKRNIIQNNRFAGLAGLSIDLTTRNNVGVQNYQIGDGHNPPRDSSNRRQDTGNGAINAPQFLSREFFVIDKQVNIDGVADPGSTVTIYHVKEGDSFYGPLSEPLTEVTADEKGQFGVSLENLQPGERISAIATLPQYGTSEPALNAVVRSLEAPVEQPLKGFPQAIPQCTTPTRTVVVTPPSVSFQSPDPIHITVPRNVHFALDEATISPASAAVLNQIAAVLQAYPTIIIEIHGHTDPRASDAYNQELGKRRAIAVRNYLLHGGIAPERMTIRSFGETQPKVPGSDRLSYARDRRVEIIFQDVRGIDIIFENQEGDLQIEP